MLKNLRRWLAERLRALARRLAPIEPEISVTTLLDGVHYE